MVSGVGVGANIMLSVIKATAGVWSGSAALISDAVNNLTDSASSLVTIIGTKMASKQPDEEHPFGHKRGEYLTSLVIGIIILVTGLQSLFHSAENILWNPARIYYAYIRRYRVLYPGEGISVFLYYKSGKGNLFRSAGSLRTGCEK